MITEILKKEFGKEIVGSHNDYGNEVVLVDQSAVYEVLKFLRNNSECPYDLLLDIAGVDYIKEDPRFEVVYHLYSLSKKKRIRIRSKVPEKDLTVKSVIDIWPAADWFEREAFDMFGIHFEGHPNLKRLLMWEEFEGYPLRKDYPIDKRQPIPTLAKLV